MIVVIGDDYLVNGLRMGGANKGIVVKDIEQFEKEVSKWLKEDVSILIIPESLLDKANWQIKKKVEESARPVVIAVPDIHSEYESSRLKELIKRALGFDLVR